MARRLAELDELDRQYGLGAVGHTPPARPRERAPRTHRVLASLFALSMFGMIVLLGVTSPARSDDEPASAGSSVVEAPSVPLDRLRPAVPVVSQGSHAFQELSSTGAPVTFDPCRPIHYVVNPVGMPPGGGAQLRDAIREISDATGLEFVEDGVTSEPLVEDRESTQPDRYGPGWAPVLIGWVDEDEFPLVGGDVVGVASSVSAAPADTDAYRYVTGVVAFDRTWFAEAMSSPDSVPEAWTTVLHELGHLVGLDHVDDRGEVMDAMADAVELGPGDRQGLAIVGSGACGTDA